MKFRYRDIGCNRVDGKLKESFDFSYLEFLFEVLKENPSDTFYVKPTLAWGDGVTGESVVNPVYKVSGQLVDILMGWVEEEDDN